MNLEIISTIGGVLSGVLQFGVTEHYRYKHAKLDAESKRDEYSHIERLHKYQALERKRDREYQQHENAEDREFVEGALSEMLAAAGDKQRLEHDSGLHAALPKTSKIRALSASVRPVLSYFTTFGTGALLAMLLFSDTVAEQYLNSGAAGAMTLSAWLAVWGNLIAFYVTQRYALKFAAPSNA